MTLAYETALLKRTQGSTRLTAGGSVAVYGYARVSTEDQDVTIQVEALTAAGCGRVMSEVASGTNRT